MLSSTAFISSRMESCQELLPVLKRHQPEPLMIGILSPGNSDFESQFADFQFHQLDAVPVVHHVALVKYTTSRGSTRRGRAGCARGSADIGRPDERHTRIEPSIPRLAAVIMFLHSSRQWRGDSTVR